MLQDSRPKTGTPQSHRFVVVYRLETREISGAAIVRRGWVERVPEPRALDAGELQLPRRGFQELAELPAILETMIADVEAQTPAPKDQRMGS